jgi:hypothetical protein
MEGTPRQDRTYYRCAARSLVPGSPALDGHPKNVYLPEAALVEPLNNWLSGLFDRRNIDRTVAALVDSQAGGQGTTDTGVAKKRLADAETRLCRYQTAIGAGVDPAALVELINDAHAQREAARAEVEGVSAPSTLAADEVRAMIEALGDIGRALNRADPALLEKFYEALRLEMVYDAESRVVQVTVRPTGRGSAGVRGGTRTLTTCLQLGV